MTAARSSFNDVGYAKYQSAKLPQCVLRDSFSMEISKNKKNMGVQRNFEIIKAQNFDFAKVHTCSVQPRMVVAQIKLT